MYYFSTPQVIGRGAYAEPEFPTPESLVAHLDYLGIDRALVYSVAAQDYSPVCGNKELLEAIAPYGDRLKPVFVLTPSDYFEHGTLDWLKEQAKLGNRCYELRLKMSRFPLRQIERLLSELHEFRPVFFIDRVDNNLTTADFEQMGVFAERYPKAYFVICRQLWTSFAETVDLMWRHKNIGVDTSYLHMRHTIELVIEEFGVDRLFFGIGHLSQYGAAVGALAHAEITDEQRELIAHGNLEKLLDLAPLDRKLAHEPEFADKPLWNAFRQGKPLSGVKVIDIHNHLAGPNTRGWMLPEPHPAEGIKEMVRVMDLYGVSQSILIANRALFSDLIRGNREAEGLAKQVPGRFKGYFVVNPWHRDEVNEEILDEFFGRDYFIGFKLLPGYWLVALDDPRYTIVYEYAEKHHLPILIHTWTKEIEPLAEIARRYPHAKFIAGHTGCSTSGGRKIAADAEKAENIYFDYTAWFCSTDKWFELFGRFDKSRFLFGSDAALHNESYELSGFLSQPVPDAELVPILAENFERILSDRC